MADDASTETMSDGSETEQADDATTDAPDEASFPDAVKKALAAERKRAREADRARKAAEAEVSTYKQRDMTEQQKLEQRASESEKAAETATRELNRLRAAAAAGLELADADLITGSTPEEMKANAERLAKRFGGGTTNFDGGTRATAGRAADMNDLIRRAASGR